MAALVVVAVVRYRKVCKSDAFQISVAHSKFVIGILAMFVLVISIPHGIVHGQVEMATPR